MKAPKALGIITALTCALSSIEANAQEDFRNRPWKAEGVRGVCHPIIRIGTDGTLLDGIPQYIFNRASKHRCLQDCVIDETPGRGLTFQLTSPDGTPVSFKGDPLDNWENYLKQTWAHVARGELAEVFKKADLGGRDTRWDAAAYGGGLRYAITGKARAQSDALFLPDIFQRPAGSDNTGAYSYTLDIGRGWGNSAAPLHSEKLKANGTYFFDFENQGGLKDASGPLRISLKRTPVRTEHVRSWLATTKRRHEPHIGPLKLELDERAAELMSIANEALNEKDANKCAAIGAKWDRSKDSMQVVIAQCDSLIAHWMIEWLWYTNGVPTLDPFKRPAAPKGTLDTLTVALLRGEVDAYDKQLACCTAERTPTESAQLVKARKDAQGALALLLKRNKEITDSTAARSMVTRFLVEPSVVLNEALLYLSNRDEQRFMRHFDGAKTYGPMTSALRGEYYTFEKRHFLVHNYRGDAKLLELTATTTDIATHDPAVAEEVNAQVGSLISLIANTAASALASGTFLAKLSPAPAQKAELNRFAREVTQSHKTLIYAPSTPMCDALFRKFKTEHDSLKQEVDHRTAQLDSILNVFEINAQADEETTLMRTVEVEMKTDLKAKQHVSYTLIQLDQKDDSKKKTLRTGTFDLYALQRMRLFGGVSFAVPWWDPVERTTVTVTNGQLTDVQRANEQARFMVGLKFHAFGGGADVDDNRFTFHPRRLAIAAGVSLPKPKDDLYLGLSYDLYPGLNVNLLCQWYRNEVVDVKNGQVLETRSVYQPVPAVAITLDSSLFTSLLKLFAL